MINITREAQIKTTMRLHLTPPRMAIIKKNGRGCGQIVTLLVAGKHDGAATVQCTLALPAEGTYGLRGTYAQVTAGFQQ